MNASRFTFLSLLLIGLSSLHPSRLLAQSGTTSRHGHSITCASDDGKRHTCKADTSNGVALINQRSGSACVQNQTWGYNSQGIWVDKGCRADFALLGKNSNVNTERGRYSNRGQSASETITCSSNGGRKNCSADTRGGVRMVRQISGSSCIEGQTWGYTSNNVWVDKGCRATFATGEGSDRGRSGHGRSGYRGSQSGATITCSSNSGGREYCNADTQGGVRMVRQISGSSCVEGQSWGYENGRIWVDHGCRATFETGRR